MKRVVTQITGDMHDVGNATRCRRCHEPKDALSMVCRGYWRPGESLKPQQTKKEVAEHDASSQSAS